MNLLRLAFTILLLPTLLHAQQFGSHRMQSSLDHALHASSASAIVIDASSGKSLASYRLSASPPREPGSTLKPLVATIALKSSTVTAQATVSCAGTLTIGQHNLKCSHPRAITIFDLQHAIAYSCNSWFAQLAEHMSVAELDGGLRSYGLSPVSLPSTAAQRQLLTLGLEDIQVTPAQLAQAYRTLAVQLDESQFASIRAGLFDSVSYGMAHNADTPGVVLAGKTGTAAGRGTVRTHGWFAGIIYSQEPRKPAAVLVVTVPDGNGADAAALARRFLLRWTAS